MVYLGLNAEYLPPTGASGNYLPGGLKKYSTQKVITYSDSTRKIVREFFFLFFKWLKLSPKVTNFCSVCRLGNVTHMHCLNQVAVHKHKKYVPLYLVQLMTKFRFTTSLKCRICHEMCESAAIKMWNLVVTLDQLDFQCSTKN